jgi:hypothetical protein
MVLSADLEVSTKCFAHNVGGGGVVGSGAVIECLTKLGIEAYGEGVGWA